MAQTVCIQGLGFVGAAMATAVASAKDEAGQPYFDVIGVDLPSPAGLMRVQTINEGRFPFETVDLKLTTALEQALGAGNLRASTDPFVYGSAEVVVVDVHLDIPFLEDEPQLQFENFVSAIRTIGQYMREDALIIIETTVPPGTCQKIVIPTLVEEFRRRGLDEKKLRVAHSYERVMPGSEYLDSIINFWRVYSGNTPDAADACEVFLSRVINVRQFPLIRLSSTTASETAKVMENTFRAVNIALIHEWAKYAEKVGIDLFEVVEAIQQRPTHRNIRYPGLGIGGYCLTKDPMFAPAAARQLFGVNVDFPFARLSVRTASAMPRHAVNRFKHLLGGSLEGKKVLLCGVAYRQDVGDTRYSPSESVFRALTELGAYVDIHDPLVDFWDELNLTILQQLPSPDGYDGVFFAVPHSEYVHINLSQWIANKSTTLIFDAFMVWKKEQRSLFRAQGVRIEAIGVADGL